MPVIYNIGVTCSKVAFTLFGRWEVDGRERVPRRGPLIVVCNHQSNADPPVLCASIPRRLLTMAKRGLFSNRLFAWVLTSWGTYPIEKDWRDMKAVNWALRMLDEGRAVAIFPESTRSPRKMRRAIQGAAYLAARSGAPVLPVGITGTENVPGLWRVALPLCRISVKIGEPFAVPRITGSLERSELETMTTQIMRRVALLLPEKYRGVYSLGASEMRGL